MKKGNCGSWCVYALTNSNLEGAASCAFGTRRHSLAASEHNGPLRVTAISYKCSNTVAHRKPVRLLSQEPETLRQSPPDT